MDLAKALAQIDLVGSKAASPKEGQLRSLQTECEALKDEVTNKDSSDDFKASGPKCRLKAGWSDHPPPKPAGNC